jgi:hypothetical protein
LPQLDKTYDLDALRRRVPVAGAPFIVGFTPWTEDADGWTRSARERHDEAPDRPLFRTIWDNPSAREARVLIDVAEGSSEADAIESLIGRLESNQLARLPEGPPDLGTASFLLPDGVPPAVFLTRGNLCISVVSFGSRPVDVLPWARRIDRRIVERPDALEAGASIAFERRRARAGEAVGFEVSLNWTLGEDGYVKLFAAGGAVARRDGRLTLTPSRAGDVTLDVVVVERGRQTYGARAALTVE